MAAPRECPCGSSKRYRECCGPLHDKTERAASPEALMRSRWSAFALGLGEYLYDTLASTHPDRAVDRAAASRELARAKNTQRFLKLTVIDAPEAAANAREGEVLFFAKIFEKGQDRSFAELSRFVVEDGAWRYESGVLVPSSALPKDPGAITRAVFLGAVS